MKFSSIVVWTALSASSNVATAWVMDGGDSTSISRPGRQQRPLHPTTTATTAAMSRPSYSRSLMTLSASSMGSPSSNANVDTRQIYSEWCQLHGKIPSEERYGIFVQNFMTQWNYDQQQQKMTTIVSVNEFADWTIEEYQKRQQEIENKIQSIYQQWCMDHNKPSFVPGNSTTNPRYETFKANFLQNMKHYEETGDFYQLNEYADMTIQEYQAMLIKEEEEKTMVPPPPSSSSSSEGTGLPSYLVGMVQPVSQRQEGPVIGSTGSAGMVSYADALSSSAGTTATSKPSPSYLPKSSWTTTATTTTSSSSSFTPTNPAVSRSSPLIPAGPGAPPKNPFSSTGWSPVPPSYMETTTTPPPLTPQPPKSVPPPSFVDDEDTVTSTSTPSGSGMVSYTDALSGAIAPPKSTTKSSSYMPKKTYRPSVGTGMPSYMDSLRAAASGGPSSTDTPTTLTPASPLPPPPMTTGSSSLPPPTTTSSAPPQRQSFMPQKKSYQPTSGSGMPSYFDDLTPASPSSKPSSFLPNKKNNTYKQSSGSGMASSYFDSIKAPPASATPESTASSSNTSPWPLTPPPVVDSKSTTTDLSLPLPTAPPMGTAGVSSYPESLSAGGGFDKSSFPPKSSSSSYGPNKSYKKASGSGMPSYFDTMNTIPSTSTPPSSYGPGKKSYKQSTAGSGAPSYFDNMPKSYETPPAPLTPPHQFLEPAPPLNIQSSSAGTPIPQFLEPAPPLDILPNVVPPVPQVPPPPLPGGGAGMASFVMPSDQAAEFRRQHVPARGGPGQPLAHKMQNPQVQASDQSGEFIRRRRVEGLSRGLPLSEFPLAHALKNPQLLQSDQHLIMKEGVGFLPHAIDPVIRRGNPAPGFFFSGQDPIIEPYQQGPGAGSGGVMSRTATFPSDQEKADNYARESLMYFQKGAHVGRGQGGDGGGGGKSAKPKVVRAFSASTTTAGPGTKNKRMGVGSSFMPKKSYNKASGTGMPSYFDNF